jgi:hypothetical protein
MEAEKYILEVWKNKRTQAVANKLKNELLNVAAWIAGNKEQLGVEEYEIPDVMKEALEYIIEKDMYNRMQFDKKMEEIGKKMKHAIIKTSIWVFENRDLFGIESYTQIHQVILEALDSI